MSDQGYITFNDLKLKEFKKAYEFAAKNEQEVFTFENHEFLVTYAKYLIEYLEGELKR